ncbi:cobalamin biosynthesis protein [Prauserella marina]|uniref:Sirohydrochlorin ferrochelatase n=1 Tax=Prauserella marina TaxID=530584 RepID=A0A222VMJ5_9PSEU|nr:sirohydrochlorin chelatase [Prauserella marina]ASR35097.1 cobalamin biosynthesis protein [Prauserella marina]PWV85151.1 sirohydrochlorin ferrochelatase [Prauserella marina]SDC03630.1 Sirohydrochlorin ferrochelatase [Prauserella marina]
MSAPPLVAVAHGSRDSRSAATIAALAGLVRAEAPGVDVREAFLDLSRPGVEDVLAALHAEGHRDVVVVPLLLGSAYHAKVDLPRIVEDTGRRFPALRVTVSDVLGTSGTLEEVALDRLAEAGADLADPGLGVVLSAVGSSHEPANAAVARMARRWQSRQACLVSPAFASTAHPDLPAAVAKLRAKGAVRFAVASWFLAPGLLPDRIHALASEAVGPVPFADPLCPDPRVAKAVLRHYTGARQLGARRSA